MNFGKLALVILGIFAFNFASAENDLDTEKELSKLYLEKMAAESSVRVLTDGVILKKIYDAKAGELPKAESFVTVLYEGFDREGEIFDSAFQRDAATTFGLKRLIPCWQIAIPEISSGSAYKVTCPAETAYGDTGAGDKIKPGAAISFRIVLLAVEEQVPNPE